MSELTHFDETGASRMVDVGSKPVTRRTARASGVVRMLPATLAKVAAGEFGKGNVIEVARLAGIMAAKRTADLIPLCHPLPLESVTVDVHIAGDSRSDGDARSSGVGTLRIEATVVTTGKTGVEMEALTAVSVAALTVYDMCKSVDRAMSIERIQLEAKSGGASGEFSRST